MRVDGLCPLVERFSFRPILLCVLAFDFEHEGFAGFEPKEKVRTVLLDDAEDLEAEVIVLGQAATCSLLSV